MGIELSYNSSDSRLDNQSESMYGNNKGKQPALSQLWLGKKTSYDVYVVHKLDFIHATVNDRHCKAMCRMCLVSKRISSQLELTEGLDKV